MKVSLVIAAVLSVTLAGSALAQSTTSPDAMKHPGAGAHGSHGSMENKDATSNQMKKMEHGGSAAGAHSDSAGHQHGSDVPSDIKARSQIDTSTTQESNEGHYRVSISPEANPVAINTMQSWVLEVMTPDGKPVQNAEVKVDGGMPRHGHGLPTSPQVTKYLGDGKYLVEGMRFNMAGWWALKFDIAGHPADSVSFNLIIQ